MKKEQKKQIKKICLISVVVLLLAGSYLIATRQMTVPFLYRTKTGVEWSIGTIRTNNPLKINTDSISVIDFSINQAHPEVSFMADPFIVEDNGEYYIFYEYFPTKMNSTWADIAVLKSKDLKNWEFLGVVLDEPIHLSYPQVFKQDGKWYMMPSDETEGVLLYEAQNFPKDWVKKEKILPKRIADATLIIKDNVFYIIGSDASTRNMRLYYSNSLLSGWQEHPQSPIRDFDIRPGGRPIVLDEKITYFIQDHSYGYGTGLIAYQIDSISPTYFADHKNDTILWRFGNGWASGGMHTLSCVELPDSSWFCVVDGWNSLSKKKWGWDWLNLPEFRIKKW